MHLSTLRAVEGGHAAVLADGEFLDLVACAPLVGAAGLLPHSIRGILEGGDEALALVKRTRDAVLKDRALADRLRETGGLVKEADARFLAPVPDPRLVLSCGRNYRTHMAEMSRGLKNPPPAATKASPTGFIKNSAAVIGPGQTIRLPKTHPNMVDWEAEFCGVIGRPCHNVSADEALDYLVGYTMINDVSARDFIPEPDENGVRKLTNDQSELNLHGKQFPTFCPMGASIATKDEIADPNDVNFQLFVNGVEKQSANSGDVFFGIADLVAYFSTFYQLRPGDVVSSGSPSGVGFARTPREFLRAGDVVEIRCDGVGRFVNPVAASN